MVEQVSVVMAVYNGERFLSEQLNSVLIQLSPEDELLVVDDCSTDRSMEMLSAIRDPRIRIVRQAVNQGVVASFDRGLCLAKNEIVFLCDQDDIWLPGKRAAFVEAFRSDAKCLLVVSDAEVIDAHGRVMHPSFMKTRNGFRGDLLSTLFRNRYLGCAMAVRRALLDVALPIPRSVPMHDMWLGSLGTIFGSICYLPHPYLRYRRHGGNVSPSRRQSLSKMVNWRLSLGLALARRVLQYGRVSLKA